MIDGPVDYAPEFNDVVDKNFGTKMEGAHFPMAHLVLDGIEHYAQNYGFSPNL